MKIVSDRVIIYASVWSSSLCTTFNTDMRMHASESGLTEKGYHKEMGLPAKDKCTDLDECGTM